MRKFLIWLLATALCLSGIASAQAQDELRHLKSGQPVSGVIDTQQLTQMYSFASKLPFANGLRLENTGALPLKIVIIDAAGTPLTTVDDIAPGTEGRLRSWLPPTDGIFYVVIYPTEALNNRAGSFTLTLDDVPLMMIATEAVTAEAAESVTAESTEVATVAATAEPTQVATEAVTTAEPTQIATEVVTVELTEVVTAEAPQLATAESTAEPTQIATIEATQVTTTEPIPIATEVATVAATAESTAVLPTATTAPAIPMTGLHVELDWQAGARLSLEIRDPQGQSIHWKNPQSADGGVFTGATDPIDCATFSPHPLTQTAMWSTALAGSYEILVHYIDGCTSSVPFTLTVTLNGRVFPALGGIAQENQTFVGGLVVNADGTGGLSSKSGMISVNATLAIQTSDLVANAEPLPADEPVQGQIDSNQPYHAYQFDGQLGDIVSAVVTHTSGSLDTMIALLDTNGNLLAINDDSADDTTDSALNKVRLRHNGTYLIVVTRYGQLVGATTGGFELTVTGVK